jgi:hypothetical protein
MLFILVNTSRLNVYCPILLNYYIQIAVSLPATVNEFAEHRDYRADFNDYHYQCVLYQMQKRISNVNLIREHLKGSAPTFKYFLFVEVIILAF